MEAAKELYVRMSGHQARIDDIRVDVRIRIALRDSIRACDAGRGIGQTSTQADRSLGRIKYIERND